jgi:MFS family permease
MLIVAGVYGSLVPEADAGSMLAVLVVLGIGWNLGVVGGSAMLIEAVTDRVRPHAEGIGEVAMGLAAAVAAPVAGVLVALAGLAAVWLAVAVVGALALAARRSALVQPR